MYYYRVYTFLAKHVKKKKKGQQDSVDLNAI